MGETDLAYGFIIFKMHPVPSQNPRGVSFFTGEESRRALGPAQRLAGMAAPSCRSAHLGWDESTYRFAEGGESTLGELQRRVGQR